MNLAEGLYRLFGGLFFLAVSAGLWYVNINIITWIGGSGAGIMYICLPLSVGAIVCAIMTFGGCLPFSARAAEYPKKEDDVDEIEKGYQSQIGPQ